MILLYPSVVNLTYVYAQRCASAVAMERSGIAIHLT